LIIYVKNGCYFPSAVSNTDYYPANELMLVFCFIIEVVYGRSDKIQGQPSRLFRSTRQ